EPEKIADPVKTVLGGDGSLVQPIKDGHEILLAGAKPQVLEALDLVERLDSPTPPAVEAFPIVNSTPTEVAALLERVTKAIEHRRPRDPEGERALALQGLRHEPHPRGRAAALARRARAPDPGPRRPTSAGPGRG